MNDLPLKGLFQHVWELLPDDDPALLKPTSTVREALELMEGLDVAVVPVVSGKEVLGVFSYRDFSLGLRNTVYKKGDGILELCVEDFLVQPKYASANDALTELVTLFSQGQVLLIGERRNFQGMVTPADALRYFFKVASPYVILKQIELAIRELIRRSVSEERLATIAGEVLSKAYETRNLPIPTKLEDMSFSDYTSTLQYRKTWSEFLVAFGKNQDYCTARLKPLPELRNDVFHFRRELTAEEYEKLRDARDWLMTRMRVIETGGAQ